MRNQVEDSLVQLFFTIDKAILEKFALRLFHPGYASRACKTWMALAS